MSKATKRHCAGTVQAEGGRVGNVKQVGLEPRPEDSYGRCGSDKIRQTVPDASSGDRKSSVTDGRQSGASRSTTILGLGLGLGLRPVTV